MGEIKFWTCLVEGTLGGYSYQHDTLESAREEAEKLARMPSNRKKRVFVLELVCLCEVLETPVQWTEVERG